MLKIKNILILRIRFDNDFIIKKCIILFIVKSECGLLMGTRFQKKCVIKTFDQSKDSVDRPGLLYCL